jgi:hypothetical protein
MAPRSTTGGGTRSVAFVRPDCAWFRNCQIKGQLLRHRFGQRHALGQLVGGAGVHAELLAHNDVEPPFPVPFYW